MGFEAKTPETTHRTHRLILITTVGDCTALHQVMTSTTLPLPPSAISTTATTTSAEQPSFSTFQREVEEKVQAETRARHVDHLKAKSIADKMNALKLGKGGKPSTVIASETATDEPIVEDDDGRTVQVSSCARGEKVYDSIVSVLTSLSPSTRPRRLEMVWIGTTLCTLII